MQVAVGEVLLDYEIVGDRKAKEYLVVLHGWGRSRQDWRKFAGWVVKVKKLNVVLVDLPGFGGSPVPKNVLGTYDYAEVIRDLVSKLGIKKYSLLGHSLGGKVAIVIASKSKEVQKLILVSPSGVTKNLGKSALGSFLHYLKSMFSWTLTSKLVNKLSDFVKSDDYKASGEMAEIFKKIVGQIVVKDASQVKAETIIVWGNKDKTVPVTDSKVLRGYIPRSFVRIVWSAKHSPHIENEMLFNEIISEFL